MLDIVNTSLSTGTFPEGWKLSTVTPVQKVTNTKLCSEYRPINNVPVYEKLLEMVVKEQLLQYCEKNNIIVTNQSGFRQGHSCESVVVNICDEFRRAVDSNHFVLAVFLDFRRAFETIDRNILVHKLERLGLSSTVLKWFKCYLCNRSQIVKFKNSLSDPISVENGVPQGTVLGPLLFLLYINDIVKVVRYARIELFADDTMIYITGKNINQMQVDMNSDINYLYNWLGNNILSVNISKSKFCVFGKKVVLANLNLKDIKLEINKERLKYDKEIKYLGVVFDAHLSYIPHAYYVMRKFSKKINFIARVGRNLSLHTKLMLYNSIAGPHLEFCSTIFYNLPNYIIHEFQIIQNRAMRGILECNRYTPINLMLNVLCMFSVKQKIVFNVYVFIFKIKNKLLPSYICDKTRDFNETHNYNTRNKNDFILNARCNSSQMANSVLYKGLYEFNYLPKFLKDCTRIHEFKKLLRDYVLKNF